MPSGRYRVVTEVTREAAGSFAACRGSPVYRALMDLSSEVLPALGLKMAAGALCIHKKDLSLGCDFADFG